MAKRLERRLGTDLLHKSRRCCLVCESYLASRTLMGHFALQAATLNVNKRLSQYSHRSDDPANGVILAISKNRDFAIRPIVMSVVNFTFTVSRLGPDQGIFVLQPGEVWDAISSDYRT